MRGFNRAIIAGNLTRDPDVRYTVNKRCYARFGVAVNYRFKNANGEYQDGVDYINVVVWGPMAENCGKYLKKGSGVLVEGRIRTSTYEAKDGSGKRTTLEISADDVQFLSSGQQQSSSSGSSSNFGGNYQKSSVSVPDFGYVPTDEDFGKSIGDRGFEGFGVSNFGDNSSSALSNKLPENVDESTIPF